MTGFGSIIRSVVHPFSTSGQVLNMKAPEILGLMEEAAGTRMFEMKKIQARARRRWSVSIF